MLNIENRLFNQLHLHQKSNRWKFSILVSLVFYLLCAVPIKSQDRPKIGLALSGGGAKGFAHIGVLKVLEEQKIPIDYISGTSIGSIIGGLYAIGYSTKYLEKLALSTNWDEMFSDNVQRRDLGMELKQWDGRYAFSLAIEGRSLQLPSGIIEGQKIIRLLDSLTTPVQHIEDFREFPIPFSCVAVDIVTGKAIVLNKGHLSEAIRASMSIPSVFTPVKINNHLLVDGGVIRNLPARDARDLGADIVIGVDVGAPLHAEESLKSLLNIVDQLTSFQKAMVNEKQQKLCNLLITPKLDTYGPTDFDEADFFIQQGEAAARAKLPELRSLLDSLNFAGDPEPPPIANPKPVDSFNISEIEITGLSPGAKKVVQSELNVFLPGRITPAALRDMIDRIYSTQLFARITYRLTDTVDGKKLWIRAKEKSTNLFRIGFRYDSRNDAAILLNTTIQNFWKFGSILAFDLKLGLNPMFDGQYFLRTIDRGRIGFRGRVNYFRSLLDVFEGAERVSQLRVISYISDFQVGRIFAKKWTLSIGVRGEYVENKPRIAPVDTRGRKDKLATLYGLWRIDTFDRTVFPTRGVFLNAEIALADKRVISNRSFRRALVDFRAMIPLHRRVSFIINTFLGATTTKSDIPIHYLFMLGGMDTPFVYLGDSNSILGLLIQERVGRNAQFLQLGTQFNLPGRKFIQLRWNAVEVFERFKINFKENKFITGFGVTAGIETRLGPVDFTLMSGNRHRLLGYVNVGYKF